ncbi:MAG: tRNA (guanosine(37)-N1)-methyltransferase TrmD [Chloroflexi bacterium]|nr:tRNA (guanosine(37)-N1)-methyltransferase TrmD [Chloroflexota bacterium]
MRFDVFTLFPGMFQGPLSESIIKRAVVAGHISIQLHNIRDYATDKHQITDDYTYGGGGGMVMKPEPIFRGVEAVLGLNETGEAHLLPQLLPPIILLSPQGRTFDQRLAWELAGYERLVLICGRYEGVDERVREHLATDEISIGDFVVTGGELPAMMIIDAVSRLIPGVLGEESAPLDDSFAGNLLEYPQFTRPVEFRGWRVPDMLMSGNHAEVDRWRRRQSLLRTRRRRPDLLANAALSKEDLDFLASTPED